MEKSLRSVSKEVSGSSQLIVSPSSSVAMYVPTSVVSPSLYDFEPGPPVISGSTLVLDATTVTDLVKL